ncbi:MAG: hypothetical protein ACLS90_00365 [Clostridia bacterium]
MKKYIGFIGVAMVNCMLITVLLVHAFTLSTVKDSAVNDSKKQYVYIEKTTVKEEKEIEHIQENVNKNNKANSSELNNNYVEKTTTTKTTYCNDSKNNTINNNQNNAINDNKNNTINNSQNNTVNNSSNSNENDANNNYTVEYTNTSYCGFCGKQLNNNDGICETCKDIRSKLGE